VFDKIELEIKQGTEYKVELTAGKNLLDNISSVNNNGVLTLINNNRCNFVRGYKKNILFTITVPKIDTVENRGVGTIRFAEGFKQDTIFLLAENSGDTYLNGTFKLLKTGSHGNGDIYINGTCDNLFVYTYGTNSFRGENLTVNKFIFIETISIGDVRVNAPENGILQCRIWRAGNIYYKGNPAVVEDYSDGSAKGRLIRE